MACAGCVFVFLSTRQRAGCGARRRCTGRRRIRQTSSATYLRRIDAVAVDAAAGRLSARASHQELSLLVRSFVRDIAGD